MALFWDRVWAVFFLAQALLLLYAASAAETPMNWILAVVGLVAVALSAASLRMAAQRKRSLAEAEANPSKQ